MTKLQYYRALRDLFSKEIYWTKEVFARDKEGNWCSVHAPTACCWCLTGGVTKVAVVNKIDIRYARRILHEQVLDYTGDDFMDAILFNDGGTYLGVVAFLDYCIKNQQSQPKELMREKRKLVKI